MYICGININGNIFKYNAKIGQHPTITPTLANLKMVPNHKRIPIADRKVSLA